MNHIPTNDLISAYVDDRLSPEERADVEGLLQSSPEARAELDSYLQLRNALKSLPQEPAASDLVARIIAQAEQESLHGKPVLAGASADNGASLRKRWTIPAVSVVVSAALLMLVMVQLNSRWSGPANSPVPESASTAGRIASDETDNTAEEADRSSFGAGGFTLSDVELRDLQGELNHVERIEMTQDGDTDGVVNMIRSYDLKTAKVGDVIDALQVNEDGVVVVQLTVIDRQQVLNSLQVLLSQLKVPRENPGENSYGAQTGDLYAVYVEADEQLIEEFVAKLQQDMDIEQMYVSTAIPSEDLNPYVSEQGYNDLWSMQNDEERLNLRPGRAPNPPQQARRKVEAALAAAENESRKISEKPFAKDELKDLKKDEAPGDTAYFHRSIARSEIPPPPPRPLSEQAARLELPSTEVSESAPPESAVPMLADRNLDAGYVLRQMPLRLPESVGNKWIGRDQRRRQLSVSNGEAIGEIRRELLQELEKKQSRFSKQPDKGAPPSPTEASVVADQPQSPRDEPAAARPALKEGESLSRKGWKLTSRPVQFLFVLTDNPAAATKPVPAADASESKPPE